MTLIPTGRPLDAALPDLPDLLADPAAYLAAAPLAIGPLPVGPLALLFAGPGAAILARAGQGAGWLPLGVGIGLVVAGLLLAAWAAVLRGNELVFRPEGLDIVRRGATIRVPWAVFHVGERIVSTDMGGVAVPINPAALAGVRLLRHGEEQATGREAVGPQWRLMGQNEAVLPVRYEIAGRDLAQLLLVLGRKLGGATVMEEAVAFDVAGWHVVPLALLRLPPCCAACAGPQDDTLTLRMAGRNALAVPVCEPCKRSIARGRLRGGVLGLLAGATLGAALGVFAGGLLSDGERLAISSGAIVGLGLGTLAGSLLGLRWGRRLPVRVRRWSPSRGVAAVWFDNPVVAAAALDRLRGPVTPPDRA